MSPRPGAKDVRSDVSKRADRGTPRELCQHRASHTATASLCVVATSRMLLAPRQRAGSPLAGAAERPPCGCAFTVIARWRENLDWTWKLRMPFVVMDKAAGNVGRESLSFLHFIVENYASRLTEMADNASACVCFTQGIISGSQFGCDRTARGHIAVDADTTQPLTPQNRARAQARSELQRFGPRLQPRPSRGRRKRRRHPRAPE